jgi:hypothetical protein
MMRLRFGLDLWLAARLLPFRVHKRRFQDVLALAPADGSTPYAGLPLRYITRRVQRVVRHPWLMRDRQCLREGLLGFRFLSRAGFTPELRFAVDGGILETDHVSAHCWVSVGDEPVISGPGPDMVTVYVHKSPEPAVRPGYGGAA